jgi:hypothetical protein
VLGHRSLTGSFRFLFFLSTRAAMSGRRYEGLGSRPSLGKNVSVTAPSSIEPTCSNVRPLSRATFAAADTSRLLTCSEAAISD